MKSKHLLIFSAAALFLIGCESKDQSATPPSPAVPVTAAPMTVKEITFHLESVGTLRPTVLMEIRPQATGMLKEIFITEGQWVEQGTPLFQIDPSPYEIKVQEADALLANNQAALKGIEKKRERFRTLAEKDFIPQIEWDDLVTQLERAQAAVKLDEARLAAAELDLSHCFIKSPIAGRVGKLDAHPGHLVCSGQASPLVSISQLDPLIVEFTVTEKEFPKIAMKARQEQMQIEVKPLCEAETPNKKGTLAFLDNQFDPKTGLLLMHAHMENGDLSLRPGQTVLVHIPIAMEANAKLIPQKAIRYNQQGPYVYIIQPDMTVAIRQLILGSEQGTEQIVIEGLDPSERVILDGHLRLSPGLTVDVVP